MKFAIISTWNGQGYSTDNTAEVLDFEDEAQVQDYLEQLMAEQNAPWDIERSPLCITFSDDENAGSFQAFELTEYVYGIIIQCNVNEVDVVDEADWEARVAIALEQADPADMKDDPEGYELDEYGRMFIPAFENEMDEQFIKLV